MALSSKLSMQARALTCTRKACPRAVAPARASNGLRPAHAVRPGQKSNVQSRGLSVVVRAESKLVHKISAEQLEKEIADRDCVLIVDFFATWCGPCLLLATELEKVASELGDKVKVLKIDVDENPELASDLKIMGLPTIVFIPREGGRPALRTEGLLPAKQIMEIVAELNTTEVAPQ